MGISQPLMRLECEGPRCHMGLDQTKLVLEWAAQQPESIPDAAFKFINEQFAVEVGNTPPRTFCCRRCQADWALANPFTPKSPRELAEEQANAAKVQQRQQAKEIGKPTVVPFNKPLIDGGVASHEPMTTACAHHTAIAVSPESGQTDPTGFPA